MTKRSASLNSELSTLFNKQETLFLSGAICKHRKFRSFSIDSSNTSKLNGNEEAENIFKNIQSTITVLYEICKI
jgi:hypothetical protein